MKHLLSKITDTLSKKTPLGVKRSSKWNSIKRQFLIKNPTCAVCGSSTKLEVHHIIPFHLDRSKELEQSNLITLCENKKYGINCHLWFGHLGNYKTFNPSVITDCKQWNEKLAKSKLNLK